MKKEGGRDVNVFTVSYTDSQKSGSTHLHQLVDPQGFVQLGQLALVGAAEEGDELLQQSLLVVAALGRGRGPQHVVQRAGHTLPAHTHTEEA